MATFYLQALVLNASTGNITIQDNSSIGAFLLDELITPAGISLPPVEADAPPRYFYRITGVDGMLDKQGILYGTIDPYEIKTIELTPKESYNAVLNFESKDYNHPSLANASYKIYDYDTNELIISGTGASLTLQFDRPRNLRVEYSMPYYRFTDTYVHTEKGMVMPTIPVYANGFGSNLTFYAQNTGGGGERDYSLTVESREDGITLYKGLVTEEMQIVGGSLGDSYHYSIGKDGMKTVDGFVSAPNTIRASLGTYQDQYAIIKVLEGDQPISGVNYVIKNQNNQVIKAGTTVDPFIRLNLQGEPGVYNSITYELEKEGLNKLVGVVQLSPTQEVTEARMSERADLTIKLIPETVEISKLGGEAIVHYEVLSGSLVGVSVLTKTVGLEVVINESEREIVLRSDPTTRADGVAMIDFTSTSGVITKSIRVEYKDEYIDAPAYTVRSSEEGSVSLPIASEGVDSLTVTTTADWISGLSIGSTIDFQFSQNEGTASREAELIIRGIGSVSGKTVEKRIVFVQEGNGTHRYYIRLAVKDVEGELLNANYVIKDGSSTIASGTTDGLIDLHYDGASPRQYTYAVSKEGYNPATGAITSSESLEYLDVQLTKEILIPQVLVTPSSKTVNGLITTTDFTVKLINFPEETIPSIDWEASWITGSSIDGETATLSFTQNTGTSTRYATITFTATVEGVPYNATATLGQEAKQPGNIKAYPESFLIDALDTTEKEVQFISDSFEEMSIVSHPNWVAIVDEDKVEGKITLRFTCSENDSDSARSGEIKCVQGDSECILPIVQQKVNKDGWIRIVGSKSYDVPSEASSISVYYNKSNISEVTIDKPDWISFINPESPIQFAIQKNNGQERQGIVTLKGVDAGGTEREDQFIVTQQSAGVDVHFTISGVTYLAGDDTSMKAVQVASTDLSTPITNDEPSVDWIIVDRAYQPSLGTWAVVYSCLPNELTGSRSGTIKFTQGSYSTNVKITQAGVDADSLDISGDASVILTYRDQYFDLTVVGTGSVVDKVLTSTTPSWIEAYTQKWNNGVCTLTYRIAETNTRRMEDITVSYQDKQVVFHITQLPPSERGVCPIWKDQEIVVETSKDFVEYHIEDWESNLLYAGKAYKYPQASEVAWTINEPISNYLGNGIEFVEGVHKIPHYLEPFTVVTNTGLAKEYLFYNNWSYKDIPNSLLLSDPINGEVDPRQWLPISWLSLGGEYLSVGGVRKNPSSTQAGNTYMMNLKHYTVDCGSTITVKTSASDDTIQYKIGNGDYALYYSNAQGGWDSLLTISSSKKTDEMEQFNYRSKQSGLTRYLTKVTPTWELKTKYWLDGEKMFNLFESNNVYLHNLATDEIVPVVITNTSCEYTTYTNNGKKPFYFTITVQESFDKYRK